MPSNRTSLAKSTNDWGGPRENSGRKPELADPVRIAATLERAQLEALDAMEGKNRSDKLRRLIDRSQ